MKNFLLVAVLLVPGSVRAERWPSVPRQAVPSDAQCEADPDDRCMQAVINGLNDPAVASDEARAAFSAPDRDFILAGLIRARAAVRARASEVMAGGRGVIPLTPAAFARLNAMAAEVYADGKAHKSAVRYGTQQRLRLIAAAGGSHAGYAVP